MKLHFAALCAAMVWLPMTMTQAQNSVPAKPAAKSAAPALPTANAAGGKTLSLSGAEAAPGAERRGIMSRDELRTCLNDESSFKTGLQGLDAQRGPLETEKASLAVDQQSFKDERTAMEADQKTATNDLNARVAVLAERIEKSNARVKAFNDAGRTGSAAERERLAINAERIVIDEERKALDADRERVVERLKQRVASYNDKAKLVDQRVVDWNTRNNQLNESAKSLEAERSEWVSNCSNRRYREDDEIAIKAGK